jgi:hypothetical protein
MNALAQGPYAWPGSYPLFFAVDGGDYSFAAAWRDRAEIFRAITDGFGPRPEAVTVNWDRADLRCDSSGDLIEAAYVEQPAGVAHFGDSEWTAYKAWSARYKARRSHA